PRRPFYPSTLIPFTVSPFHPFSTLISGFRAPVFRPPIDCRLKSAYIAELSDLQCHGNTTIL
ncbi:MAG: hypothetical protein WBA23_07700, partial [Tunicatimonas sp.]|uniref:hypothetical protein n=1 Tax=Tunicatimonas sp. TaxID=1940096 RepID=UPI003C7112BE